MNMQQIAFFAGVVAASAALAQQPEAKPAEKPAEKPAAAPKPAPPPAQPSLDDLLGIKPKPGDKPAATITPTKPEDSSSTPDGAPDQSRADLDRLLSAQEIGDAFKQAIALMGDASKRMNEHADNGLGTQRVQEDVVKRLDQLLASLDKQKQQGGDPKPGPKNQDSQQEPGPSKPKPGQGQGQPKPQPGGDGMQQHEGPTLQEGTLKPELESARAAWGSLPARIRAMLMQGTEDRFSSRYKALTQEYYKRLAEENSK